MTLLGEMFPADPMIIGAMLEPMGLAAGPVVPTREWRELYAALDCAPPWPRIHPFYTASVREFQTAGRPVVARRRSGHDGTEAWLQAVGTCRRCAAGARSTRPRTSFLPAIKARWRARPSRAASRSAVTKGPNCWWPAADRKRRRCAYVGTACPRRRGARLTSSGCRRVACTCSTAPALEQDIAAVREFRPDLAIGTTPVVQAAKQASIPSLYFTNLISARPLLGPMGAGSLAQVINAAIGNKARFEKMREFFGDVGGGDQAGVWEGKPVMRPEFKAETKRQVIKMMKKRKAEEMI
jgi:chlorophyllide a reductase subunit Y